MHHKFITLIICLSTWTAQASDLSDFFDRSDTFLKKYVSNGLVAYAQISKEKKNLDELSKIIGSADLKSVDVKTKKAFLINAYNILVIESIVNSYPVKSPMNIDGFFDKTKHLVAGEQLTLNELEKERLFKIDHDARLHFVLVCAAISCPTLANAAFRPDQLEQQLTDRTRNAVNDAKWLKVNASKKTVELSKIFEWYQNDFLSGEKSLINWINQYRNSKIPATYTIGYYEYNWDLNGK